MLGPSGWEASAGVTIDAMIADKDEDGIIEVG